MVEHPTPDRKVACSIHVRVILAFLLLIVPMPVCIQEPASAPAAASHSHAEILDDHKSGMTPDWKAACSIHARVMAFWLIIVQPVMHAGACLNASSLLN